MHTHAPSRAHPRVSCACLYVYHMRSNNVKNILWQVYFLGAGNRPLACPPGHKPGHKLGHHGRGTGRDSRSGSDTRQVTTETTKGAGGTGLASGAKPGPLDKARSFARHTTHDTKMEHDFPVGGSTKDSHTTMCVHYRCVLAFVLRLGRRSPHLGFRVRLYSGCGVDPRVRLRHRGHLLLPRRAGWWPPLRRPLHAPQPHC